MPDPPPPTGPAFQIILRIDEDPETPGGALELLTVPYHFELNSTPPTGWVSADRDGYRAAYMFIEHPTDGFIARATFVGGYSSDPDISVSSVVFDQGGADATHFLYDGTPWDPEVQGTEANDAPLFDLPPVQQRTDERPVIRMIEIDGDNVIEVRNYGALTAPPDTDINQIEHITTPFTTVGRRPDSVPHTVYDRVQLHVYYQGKIAIGIYYDIIHPDYYQTSTLEDEGSPVDSPPEDSPEESPSPEDTSPSPPDEGSPTSPEEPPVDSPIIDSPDVDPEDSPPFGSPGEGDEFCPPTFMAWPSDEPLEWTVHHADRFGNERRIMEGWSNISGSPLRTIDGVSSITVDFDDDPGLLTEIRPWGSELQLRHGGVLAWAGPVTAVTYEYTPGNAFPVTITASDLLHWLTVRVLKGNRPIAPAEVATQVYEIIRRAMVGDDIGLGINPQFVSVRGGEILTEITEAASEMDTFKNFLDWTMMGRELLIGKEEAPFATAPNLILPDHARSFTATNSGDEVASQILVRGGDDHILERRINAEYPTGAERVDPLIGRVQRLFRNERIKNDQQAFKMAKSIHAYAQPPVWILDVDLDLGRSPYTMSHLIAGARVNVYYPPLLRDQSAYRIRTVGLSVDGDSETVSLELIPLGIQNNQLAAEII